MSDEKKKDASLPHDKERQETFFLPPLKMILAFFDKEKREQDKKKKPADKKENITGKHVEKLIEKLSEKEE